jgi:hypothetical protein
MSMNVSRLLLAFDLRARFEMVLLYFLAELDPEIRHVCVVLVYHAPILTLSGSEESHVDESEIIEIEQSVDLVADSTGDLLKPFRLRYAVSLIVLLFVNLIARLEVEQLPRCELLRDLEEQTIGLLAHRHIVAGEFHFIGKEASTR